MFLVKNEGGGLFEPYFFFWPGASGAIFQNATAYVAPRLFVFMVVSLGRSDAYKNDYRIFPFKKKQVSHENYALPLVVHAFGIRLCRISELPLAHGLESVERKAIVGTSLPHGTKMVSIRMSDEEVARIDAIAQSVSLTRADYIRVRLKSEEAIDGVEKIAQLIGVLRQLERMMDTYLSILERLVENHEGTNGKEGGDYVLDEMKRSRELMELLFKAQRQAVWTLRHIRRERRG